MLNLKFHKYGRSQSSSLRLCSALFWLAQQRYGTPACWVSHLSWQQSQTPCQRQLSFTAEIQALCQGHFFWVVAIPQGVQTWIVRGGNKFTSQQGVSLQSKTDIKSVSGVTSQSQTYTPTDTNRHIFTNI